MAEFKPCYLQLLEQYNVFCLSSVITQPSYNCRTIVMRCVTWMFVTAWIAEDDSRQLAPVTSPHEDTGNRKLVWITCIGVASVVVFLLLVLVIAVLRCRKLINNRSLVVDDYKPPKRRVVVIMHSNSLYESSTTKDSESLLLPLVRIEGGKGRLPSDFFSVSDYEIPLDRDWEFPREK